MSNDYIPPFTMTEEITNLTIEIGQYVGMIATYELLHPNPVLHRENRIRSIHSFRGIHVTNDSRCLERIGRIAE